MNSPALSRVDRSFEPGFPGGLLAAALGFPLRGGHAHHNRFRFPYFECWLKKLLPITNSAGDDQLNLFLLSQEYLLDAPVT